LAFLKENPIRVRGQTGEKSDFLLHFPPNKQPPFFLNNTQQIVYFVVGWYQINPG
jgi:hypothetical protein